MADMVIMATGRRKEAVATVRLLPGKGRIIINGRSMEEYFPRYDHRKIIMQPFEAVNHKDKFDTFVKVKGGGISGQAEAIRCAIAKAMSTTDEGLKIALRKKGLLTRDSRVKERKKYGQKGARKRFQWTKR